VQLAAEKPAAPPEDRVLTPQPDQGALELEQRLVGVLPVVPRDLVCWQYALLFPRWVRPISSPAQFFPAPSYVAPSGTDRPGQICIE
jgi:hypothetical protein